MDKNRALNELIDFVEKYGVKRDTTIGVYSSFKNGFQEAFFYSPAFKSHISVQKDEFWDYINTTDIRNLFKTENRTSVSIDLEDAQTNNTLLRKENLRKAEKLNYERRTFNKQLKDINCLEELTQEVVNSIKKLPHVKTVDRTYTTNTESNGVGVVVISDVHFNELINTPYNKYDFEIASKRLKKLATRAKKYFKSNGSNTVVVMLLGDLMNSDRLKSEVFNMATNRSRAMVLGFYLLRQFIEDLLENVNITVASVSGNESRVVGEEFDTSDMLVTYNYDYTIHEFLKLAFENNKNISFIDGNFAEKVLNINGSNVLITHGVNLKSDLEKSVQQTFGRYSSNGIPIDYLFCGHMHSARIGDTCARCGSLCGGNSYSEGALNLNSRASQLVGIFYPDKTNEVLRVDLQNVDGIEGYDIIKELEEYNVKSENKKNKFLIHNV